MLGRAQNWNTDNSLEQHIALMRRQVQRSVDDPATRILAGSVISGNFDNMRDPRTGQEVPVVPYYGRWYRGAPSWDAASLCAQRDGSCEVTAIWNFLVMGCRYFQDTDGADVFQDLRATLEAGGGDCDDLTIAFAALLKSVGYENVIARVVSTNGAEWQHVYACVKIPRLGWCALDMTEEGKPIGWEYPNLQAKRDFAL